MLRDIISFFITPMMNSVVLHFAKANGASLKFCHETRFYVPDTYREMVQVSMDEVVQFFGSDWSQYEGLIKKALVCEGLDTRLVFSNRFLIIKKSDTSRMASSVHLAGWLVAYFKTMKFYKANGGRFFRNRKKDDLARKEGAEARKRFLASR